MKKTEIHITKPEIQPVVKKKKRITHKNFENLLKHSLADNPTLIKIANLIKSES